MRRRQRRREWLAVVALSLGGCASTCGDTSDPGAIGELGNGRFLYQCGGSSDPVCEFTDPGENFPQCIVLGGRFDLEYELLDGSALADDLDIDPVLYVESVNQSFFEGDDDFEARRTGSAAFVARESEHVLDLIHLSIVTADDFDIADRDPVTPTDEVSVSVGETANYRIIPRHGDCQQLGGAPSFTANSSDEAIATVSAGDTLRVQGQAEGIAVVRVQLGDLEKMLTVNVGAALPDPDTDGGTTGDESGTAGDTASGTMGDPGTTGNTEGGSTGGSTGGGM